MAYPKILVKTPNLRKVALTIVLPLFVAILILATIKLYWLWRAKGRSDVWKPTAFQRLNITVGDVIECLKEDHVIGKGGAGIVYRGSMPSGTEVEIKRLVGRGGSEHDRGFTAEITTPSKIRHRHIVKLLGFVSNRPTCCRTSTCLLGAWARCCMGAKGPISIWAGKLGAGSQRRQL